MITSSDDRLAGHNGESGGSSCEGWWYWLRILDQTVRESRLDCIYLRSLTDRDLQDLGWSRADSNLALRECSLGRSLVRRLKTRLRHSRGPEEKSITNLNHMLPYPRSQLRPRKYQRLDKLGLSEWMLRDIGLHEQSDAPSHVDPANSPRWMV